MAIFLVKRIFKDGFGGHYDENMAMVIRAQSHLEARRMAAVASTGGDEEPEVWLDPKLSSCQLVDPEQRSEVILIDFNAG